MTKETGADLLSWGFDTETVTDLGPLAISSTTERTPEEGGPRQGFRKEPELPSKQKSF